MRRWLICVPLLVAGCAEDTVAPAPFDAAPPLGETRWVLQYESTTACSIDADCAPGLFCFAEGCAAQCETDADCASGICDDRGRCEAVSDLPKGIASRLPLAPPVTRMGAAQLLTPTQTFIDVAPGATEVTFAFRTSTDTSQSGGIAYRLQSAAMPSLNGRVIINNEATDHTITLPVGYDDLMATDSGQVDVEVITPIGTVPLILKSVLTVAGRYEGTLRLDGLGTEIPLSFGIDGDMGALGTGVSNAFLVVPADAAALFAPVALSQLPAANLTKEVRRPLEFDTAVGYWTTTFVNAYDIPATEVFGELAATQVKRSLRFELKVESDRTITGSVADTWEGLYDAAQSDGSKRVASVLLGGSFSMKKTGDQPATTATAYAVTANSPAPVLQQFAPSAECQAAADLLPECDERTSTAGRLACADGLSAVATPSKTLTEVVAGLLAGDLYEGKSFQDFLQECAAGTISLCVPKPEANCAIQWKAYAFDAQLAGYSADKERLWESFGNLLLETTGGPQLGAFFVDTDLRRDWLENANYGSTAITSAAAAQLNANLMTEYVEKVVGPNQAALRGYLQPAAFAFLSRVPDTLASIDQRDRLLISMVTSWTSTADAIALAAQRWNEIYRLDNERRAKAAELAAKLGELYRSAAVIIQLHQEAGKAAEAAPIATGLGKLMLRYEALTLSFNELLFARDGEVAISSSLDPTQAAQGVVAQRRETALESIADASTKVDGLLSTLFENDLRNTQLYINLNNAVSESQRNLAALCGLPRNCNPLNPDDAANASCDTAWQGGLCGFEVAKGNPLRRTPREVNYEASNTPSEAGLAVRRISEAAASAKNMVDVRAAMIAKRDSFTANYQAFTTAKTARVAERVKEIEAVEAAYAALGAARGGTNAKIQAKVDESVVQETAQQKAIDDAAKKLKALRGASAGIQSGLLITEKVFNRLSATFGRVGDFVQDIKEGVSNCPPTSVGLATDVTAPIRCSIQIAGIITGKSVLGLEVANGIAADAAATTREITALSFEAKVAAVETEANRLTEDYETSIDKIDLEISRLALEFPAQRDALERVRDLWLMKERHRVEVAQELIEEIRLDRDEHEFYQELVVLEGEVAKAAAALTYAQLDYKRVVAAATQERAELVRRRLQREQISQLIGGPQAVFFAANGLVEAEREIDRAKRKMNDWLVSLEYAAVRPFYNERMSILLARNTYQLRAIADRLSDLEAQCGGATSQQEGTISLRRDLLQLTQPQVDPVSGLTLSPEQRFRALLLASNVPADARMRISVSETAQQIATNARVVNFDLGLNDFANLALTCNAKIAGISLRIVGTNLGSGQPVATLLYNGQTSTYSCQPGIDAYVRTFGQGDTTFGATTSFVVNGRSTSPVAGITEMGSPSLSFAGLPLAGGFTLVIDPALPANQGINWDALDDIEIGLSYGWQDVFASESDCANSL